MEVLARAPRFKVDYSIALKKLFSNNQDMVKIKNISMSGAFIEMTTEEFNTRELVGLNFVVNDRERVVQARIVWKSKEGLGVQFIPQTFQDQVIINDLIFLLRHKVGTINN